MKKFRDYVRVRDLQEGLWLNDDKAVEGLSKVRQPKPRKPQPKTPVKNTLKPFKLRTVPQLFKPVVPRQCN